MLHIRELLIVSIILGLFCATSPAEELPEAGGQNLRGFTLDIVPFNREAADSWAETGSTQTQEIIQVPAPNQVVKPATNSKPAVASKPTAAPKTAPKAKVNKYGMPSLYVKVSKVVYERVPQTPDHRRRSLASRGAMNSTTVARRKMVDVDLTPIICRQAERYNLDPWLVKAIIKTESNFYPYAGSYAGAGGLMQLMPATASSLGCKDRFDPESNIAAGCRYLRQMLNMFDNDYRLAIAAYNAGPGNVRSYGGVPPFRETQNYVNKITRLWKEGKAQAAKQLKQLAAEQAK